MYLSGVFTTPVGFTIQPAFGPSTIQVVISVSGGILFGFMKSLIVFVFPGTIFILVDENWKRLMK